jgi:hypothetical protein
LESVTAGPAELTLQLGTKHTDCLAKEKCGVAPEAATEPARESCCAGSGCCG